MGAASEGAHHDDPISQLNIEWQGVIHWIKAKGNAPYITKALCVPGVVAPDDMETFGNTQSRKISPSLLRRSSDRRECNFTSSGPTIIRNKRLNLNQTTLDREDRCFGAGFHAELCKDVADMRFDGEFIGCEDAGDVFIG